jgi:hypothetical protein
LNISAPSPKAFDLKWACLGTFNAVSDRLLPVSSSQACLLRLNVINLS